MIYDEFIPNERLRQARADKGWTQEDLAAALETNFETVSRWERGTKYPSARFRSKLCQLLGQSVQELGLAPYPNTPLLPEASSAVFLLACSSDLDIEEVKKLKQTLSAQGMTIWSLRTVGRYGLEYKRMLLQAILRATPAVLMVVTPRMRALQTPSMRDVNEALQLASIHQRPLYAVMLECEQWEECFPSAAATPTLLVDLYGKEDQAALSELVIALQRSTQMWADQAQTETGAVPHEAILSTLSPEPVQESPDSPISPASQVPRNPYKGLRAFRHEDAQDFFGRDALVATLIKALDMLLSISPGRAEKARLLAILGPSGSGKSSVAMAGLVPHLQAGAISGSEQWVYLDPLIPGSHPLEVLAQVLSRRLPQQSLSMIRDELEEENALGLHRLAGMLVGQNSKHVVLVVDQCEELFTLTATEEERQAFLDLLLAAITEPAGPLIVVLTLRTDLYDRFAPYRDVAILIQQQHQLVLPLDMQDVRAVIERPAALPDVDLVLDQTVVSELLVETQGQIGALPLLEFTLDQLFLRRQGHRLTLEAYRELGGVKGALAQHAEATYEALHSEEHRRLARALFMRLIDPGISEQDTTRRRAAFTELSLPDLKQTLILRQVADAFVAARLLTTNEIAGTTTIEVSHEALIRAWPRLAEWLREGREDIHLQQALSQDVEDWERRGKPKDRLYRGSQLKEATVWAKRNVPSRSEMTFLQAGAAYQTRIRVSIAALVLSLVLLAGLVTQIVQIVQALNMTRVVTRSDTGPGSLRQAINTAPSGSTITIDPALRGTILLTGENLDIGKSLTIQGPGARNLAISSGSRGFFIHVAPGASVTISGLAFTHSTITTSTSIHAGFITNEGRLSLLNCTVSDNTAVNIKGVNAAGKGGGIYNLGILSLTNSIVSHNTAAGSIDSTSESYGGSGGGIFNKGILTLTNSVVSNNTAASSIGGHSTYLSGGGGGGILNDGTMDLINSVVSNNTAAGTTNSGGAGGGILNNGTLSLTKSTVSHNTAGAGTGPHSGGFGGGINNGNYNNVNPLTLTQSTVSDNIAAAGIGPYSGGYGGGIYNNMSPLTITDSTIARNKALGGNIHDSDGKNGVDGSGGGGIYNSGGDNTQDQNNTRYINGLLALTNSTISDNSADSSGGGISNWGAEVTMTFCTIYGNTAASGGGLAVKNGYHAPGPVVPHPAYQPIAGHAQLQDSLVASNHAPSGADIVGTVTSSGYNLILDSAGATFDPAQRPSTDVLLPPNTDLKIDPQLSGTAPQTHALLQGSPAIDVIPNAACHPNGVATDQRGVKRPQGNKCDIGAYENLP